MKKLIAVLSVPIFFITLVATTVTTLAMLDERIPTPGDMIAARRLKVGATVNAYYAVSGLPHPTLIAADDVRDIKAGETCMVPSAHNGTLIIVRLVGSQALIKYQTRELDSYRGYDCPTGMLSFVPTWRITKAQKKLATEEAARKARDAEAEQLRQKTRTLLAQG